MDRPEYDLTIAHLAAFGSIIQSFARFELLLAAVVSKLINSELEHAIILMSGLTYSNKRNAVRSLLNHVELPVDQKEKIAWFISQAHKHNRIRNAIAHHTWKRGTRHESIKPMYIEVRDGVGEPIGHDDSERDYLLDEFVSAADELAKIYNDAVDYLGQRDLIPSMA